MDDRTTRLGERDVEAVELPLSGLGTDTGPRRLSLLHVDDEPQQTELLSSYLERIDSRFDVLTETGPGRVIDRLHEQPVDCIISDYQMPGMDGIELLRAVRDAYPNLPFFLYTGKGSEAVASEAIDAGVTSYIRKGGTESYEQLAHRITNAVAKRNSDRRARVARDQLFELFEQTDGFYVLDGDWTVSYWNRRIADRTGVPAEDALGENFWDLFPDAVETVVWDHFREAMTTEEPCEFELRYDPHDYWAEVRAYPVDDGLFVHSRETTRKNERKSELERRNQVVQSFASTVSHDLRNPLNVAEGRLQLAQETGDFEYLEEVAEAHNRMRNLIDELLRLARGEDLVLTDVSLETAAQLAWDTVSSEETTLVVEDDLVFEAHESELRRLFENLFWNAIDHGDAGTIRVGSLERDGFFVEDDGTGVPPDEREVVFESGFSTTDASPGFGLSIIVGIVDNHDWAVELGESTAGGARFEVIGVDLS